jgi:hypothetical protein
VAWYDINKTLTYNCLFNIIIGNRGSGKSYGAKKRAVKLFLEKGHQFIYLRRFKDELDETKESYFNDIILNGEFPDNTIKFENDMYFIDGKVFGYAMALTKAKDYKTISLPLVYLILFEEFLIEDNGYSHYLKNEVKQFLGFYMSIDRYREVIVFFLANAVTMVNPYTMYWNLSLPYNSNIIRRGDVLLQLVNDEEFIRERKNTRFGKLIEGTDFAEYAIENKFVADKKDFICKKTEKCQYYFTIKYNAELYGVWVDYDEGKFFVSKDVDPYHKLIYSVTLDDHSPNTLLLKNVNKSAHFKNFIDGYKEGIVYFENMKIKSVVYNVIKLCIGR